MDDQANGVGGGLLVAAAHRPALDLKTAPWRIMNESLRKMQGTGEESGLCRRANIANLSSMVIHIACVPGGRRYQAEEASARSLSWNW